MTPPLYARLLGPRWEVLPDPIRLVHSPAPRLDLAGLVRVDGAANPLARLVRRVMGFPEPGGERPIAVTIEIAGRGERWTRRVGGRRFSSELSPSSQAGLIEERFGPISVTLDLPSDERGLAMIFVGWRLGPLALPRLLAPSIAAREFIDDGRRFNFDVAITLPVIGPLVAYRGWLELAETNAANAS